MTGHQINSLVGDLVAMAQAMERLPQVEAELADARNVLVEMDKAQDSLKADLEQSRSYAASLEAKVHAAEASRDDAELRFLELDEKAHSASSLARAMQTAMEQVIVTLAPPAPMPEPIVSEVRAIDNPMYYNDPQVSGVKPIDDGSYTNDPRLAVPMPGSLHELVAGFDDPPQGQSEADPTAQASVGSELSTADSLPVGSQDIASIELAPSWASPTPPKPQPYAGIYYKDYPKYVPLQDWLDGGGTEHSYYR